MVVVLLVVVPVVVVLVAVVLVALVGVDVWWRRLGEGAAVGWRRPVAAVSRRRRRRAAGGRCKVRSQKCTRKQTR